MGRKGTRFLEMEIEIVQRCRGVAFMVMLAHAFFNLTICVDCFLFKGNLNIISKEDLILYFWTAYI